MSWLDERIAEANTLAMRSALIEEHATAVYESLWSEIKAKIEEAKTKGFSGLMTNGRPTARKIILPDVVPALGRTLSAPREIMVELRKSEQSVVTTGAKQLSFVLDVCEDGVVCLKFGENSVTVERAAELIITPLLFPELQKP